MHLQRFKHFLEFLIKTSTFYTELVEPKIITGGDTSQSATTLAED
jgi:hypothetical protein